MPAPPSSTVPLDDAELDELQTLLDAVPAPLEPLDASMLDGYLCGVLLQPRRVEAARWWPHVTDVDARALPARFDATRLHALVQRRYLQLDAAIERRQWFDPWVFELDDDDLPADDASIDAVYPWVAGFATALELFPQLMELPSDQTTEPLALVYRHLASDDLEDADELIAEIDSLEPPQDLTEAVEGLVRATLLLADVSRPVAVKRPTPRPRRRSDR
ncbi:MAG TPA: YecA family protein [Burkholderiaceae bacterium]|nr:YecA family protein [Burkholderiaceae bacterium]